MNSKFPLTFPFQSHVSDCGIVLMESKEVVCLQNLDQPLSVTRAANGEVICAWKKISVHVTNNKWILLPQTELNDPLH